MGMSDEEIYQEAREKKQQIKHLYGKLYGDLTDLFCRYDPMGLVNMGAPENEYEPEVQAVLPRLKEACSMNDLRYILYEEFTTMFSVVNGPAPRHVLSERSKEKLDMATEETWRLWQTWRTEHE